MVCWWSISVEHRWPGYGLGHSSWTATENSAIRCHWSRRVKRPRRYLRFGLRGRKRFIRLIRTAIQRWKWPLRFLSRPAKPLRAGRQKLLIVNFSDFGKNIIPITEILRAQSRENLKDSNCMLKEADVAIYENKINRNLYFIP